VRNESHHRTASRIPGDRLPARSASAAPPGRRIRTGGAGGRNRIGALPGSVLAAARGRSNRLRIAGRATPAVHPLRSARREAPASPSRPSRLPSNQLTPVGKAGIKEENR